MNFKEWMRERDREEFLADVHRLAAMLYWSSKKESELDDEVKLELTTKLLEKIDRRREKYARPGLDTRWDARHWRGVEPIRQRLIKSYGADAMEYE